MNRYVTAEIVGLIAAIVFYFWLFINLPRVWTVYSILVWLFKSVWPVVKKILNNW